MVRIPFPRRTGARTQSYPGPPPSPRPPPPPPIIGNVLDTYQVPRDAKPSSCAEVFVVDDEGTGKYLVRLPELSQFEARALDLLRRNLLDSVPVGVQGDSKEIVTDYVHRVGEATGFGETVREAGDKLLYFLMRDFVGFWEVDPLMEDDRIEEISLTRVDKPVRVLHRDFSEYAFMETDILFPGEDRLQAFIRRLAQVGGTSVSLAQPSLEVTLQGRSDRRVTATLGDEISRPGSTFTVRKQKERPLTLPQLASPEPPGRRLPDGSTRLSSIPAYDEVHAHKTLSVLMGAYFWLLLERTTNVLVAGETNSGKTTLMNAILALTNPKSKIVTAEDVLEISLPDHLHWQRLKTRTHRGGAPSGARAYDYGLPELLKLSLRFSPTILSLGEMRGEESETLAAAITLGFSTMTTIHAENAERCIQRLTTAPMKFAEGHVRDITAIASMRKITLPDGRVVRRVVSVDEVRPVGPDGHVILNIFRYDHEHDSFEPTTPAEVMDRSYRLNEIAQSFGWSPARVQMGLTARAAFIAKRVADGSSSPKGLSDMVRDFTREETIEEAPGR